jgi:hypothetical protein
LQAVMETCFSAGGEIRAKSMNTCYYCLKHDSFPGPGINGTRKEFAMDLLSMLLNQGDGGAVRQLAGNLGLDENQAVSAISSLLPALGQGLAQNASTPGGLEGLLGALTAGGHQRYLEDPSTLGQEETVRDGNGILGHILGSKEVSRKVAQQAAEKTGVGVDLLKKMLPMVAAMTMGTLSRHAVGSGGAAPAGSSAGGLMGLLGQFLDSDRDGSAVDNVLGMASRLFQK